MTEKENLQLYHKRLQTGLVQQEAEVWISLIAEVSGLSRMRAACNSQLDTDRHELNIFGWP